MDVDIDRAIEVLGQAAAGIIPHNEEFKQACFAGKDALARHARAIREAQTQEDTLKKIADHGLFILRLNNSDWVAGKASYVYQLDIMDDHYADPNLSISSSLSVAVDGAIELLSGEETVKKASEER